ncbi:MAG: helix-turn-helix domain-containing protein, partial [Oscillospiraceae bacterium]|nr:helix-turn-helix domain-containing protein [Oscillospiraceae bacterium]
HNYYRELSAQDIADDIGITRGYLSSCFKEVFQLSVQEYITEYRLKKAKEMLVDPDLKIKEIVTVKY